MGMADTLYRALSFIRYNCVSRGRSNGEGFRWREAIADALILAGVVFFSTLLGEYTAGVELDKGLLASAIASGLAFFKTLAIKRGLYRSE